jgi:hypothetical protein
MAEDGLQLAGQAFDLSVVEPKPRERCDVSHLVGT